MTLEDHTEDNHPSENAASMPHVLVVDDDTRIRDLVSRFLLDNGFVAATAANVKEAEILMKSLVFDALVVDIMMPGQNGIDMTRAVRENSDIPVLLLTALNESEDRIAGLESGADDYLPKPFAPRELVLRLKAILRRRPEHYETDRTFRIGHWIYEAELKALTDRNTGEKVVLTTVEDNLLRAMASRNGQVVTRDELAEMCELDAGSRTIDVQVTRLRRKLEEDSRNPLHLQTVRGKGYLLRVDPLT